MPRRVMVPLRFAGVGLSPKGSRKAYFDYMDGAFATPTHTPVTVSRLGAGRFPSYARSQAEAKVLPLKIIIISRDSEGQFWALSKLFDPTSGPQYLEVEDADGVEKRVLCVPQGIILPEAHDKPLVVPLFAADPRLEANAASVVSGTKAAANLASSQLDLSVRNEGSTDALPTITITPLVATTPLQGYAQMAEIAYANRSELPLTGPASGTWLLELTGGWNTAAIINTAITTTCSTTITAAQGMPFDVTVTSTAGWDPHGMLIVTTGGTEQFAYEVIDATTIRLLGRAMGGTTAVLHTANFTVTMSRMQLDGRDIAVFLDEAKVPDRKITIDGINTTTTKVWIEIADAAAFSALTTAAVTTGLSYITLPLPEGHGFAAGDWVLWTNDAAAIVGGIIASQTVRSVFVVLLRNSPAFGTTSAGRAIYRADRHIQLAWDSAVVGTARPVNPDPPLIDTDVSTNLTWYWNGAPVWAEGNQRPGGWRRIVYDGRDDVLALRRNRLSTRVGLDDDGAGRVRFTDTDPDAAKPNFDAIEFRSPLGIDDAAGAIEYDANVDWPFVLQVIGRDMLGIDELISNRCGHEAGVSHLPPAVYTNQQETPAAVLQAVIFRARNAVVTGCLPISLSDEATVAEAVDGQDAQGFTLDALTAFLGVMYQHRVTGASARIPQAAIAVKQPSGAPGARLLPATAGISSASGTYIVQCFYQGGERVFPAGEYQLEVFQSTGAADLRAGLSLTPIYARGNHWEIVTGVWTEFKEEDFWFALLSVEADNQEEMLASSRSGLDLLAENITVVFDPNRTPICTMRAAEAALHVKLDFWRTTAQVDKYFSFEWLTRSASHLTYGIVVDCAANTVVDYINFSIRAALFDETDPWLRIVPGTQDIRVRAPGGCGEYAIAISYRSTWQA